MAFDPIEGWFEKGFRVRQQRAASVKRDRVRARCGHAPASTSGVQFSSGAKVAMRNNIKSVARRAPEVMVKITGNSDGMRSVRDHLDYISRNGKLELTDENGDTIHGRDQLYALRQQLKASQIPDESKKREFLHVVFSMPAGTSANGVKDAVERFCKEEFANRHFVSVLHDDKDHTHVHVCVGTRDIDRADAPRLSPRKADLFRWRQGFADKLRENGIDAAASERRHRFNYRRSEHGAIRQMRKDHPTSVVDDERRARRKAEERTMRAHAKPATDSTPRVPKVIDALAAELKVALKNGQRPANPHAEAIERSKGAALAGWGQVARNLVVAGDADLARHVASLMREAQKPTRSRAQELYDAAQDRDHRAEHDR